MANMQVTFGEGQARKNDRQPQKGEYDTFAGYIELHDDCAYLGDFPEGPVYIDYRFLYTVPPDNSIVVLARKNGRDFAYLDDYDTLRFRDRKNCIGIKERLPRNKKKKLKELMQWVGDAFWLQMLVEQPPRGITIIHNPNNGR